MSDDRSPSPMTSTNPSATPELLSRLTTSASGLLSSIATSSSTTTTDLSSLSASSKSSTQPPSTSSQQLHSPKLSITTPRHPSIGHPSGLTAFTAETDYRSFSSPTTPIAPDSALFSAVPYLGTEPPVSKLYAGSEYDGRAVVDLLNNPLGLEDELVDCEMPLKMGAVDFERQGVREALDIEDPVELLIDEERWKGVFEGEMEAVWRMIERAAEERRGKGKGTGGEGEKLEKVWRELRVRSRL